MTRMMKAEQNYGLIMSLLQDDRNCAEVCLDSPIRATGWFINPSDVRLQLAEANAEIARRVPQFCYTQYGQHYLRLRLDPGEVVWALSL